MPVKIVKLDDIILVQLGGVLTFHKHEEGEQLMRKLSLLVLEPGIRGIKLDLAETLAMDSHWLGIMVRVLRRCRDKSLTLQVHNANRDLRRLFESVQLDRIVTLS